MSITQPGCVFAALGTQHAMRICGLPRSTTFYTLSHKRHDFRGGGGEGELLNIKCVFQVSLQLLPEIFFILTSTEGDMIENVY
jgi:hypothetical protein